jgi:hypothetical protein
MARKLKLTHLRASDTPRDHYFLSVCKGLFSPERGSADASCPWYEACGRAPLRAQRTAKTHAKRHPDHEVNVINLSLMECVTTYRFSAMDDVENDEPPF